VQYRQPPITIEGRNLQLPDVDGFTIRFKVFDYGVISVGLSRPVSAGWAEWLDVGLTLHDNAALAKTAEQLARTLAARMPTTMSKGRQDFLSEDYLVFAVTQTDAPVPADKLVATYGDTIAQLLRGERSPLSADERDEALRHRISYFADDVVITTWSSAFVRDT